MPEFKLLSGQIAKATSQSGWFDIFTSIDVKMYPGIVSQIPTGVTSKMSPGLRVRVEGKSGKALSGIEVHAGCIDADYPDEWFVIATLNMPYEYLQNTAAMLDVMRAKQREAFAQIKDYGHLTIPKGTAIAQFKIELIPSISILTCGDAIFIDSGSTRTGGLGSTDRHLEILSHFAQSQKLNQRVYLDDAILKHLCNHESWTFVTVNNTFTGTLKEAISKYGGVEIINIEKPIIS